MTSSESDEDYSHLMYGPSKTPKVQQYNSSRPSKVNSKILLQKTRRGVPSAIYNPKFKVTNLPKFTIRQFFSAAMGMENPKYRYREHLEFVVSTIKTKKIKKRWVTDWNYCNSTQLKQIFGEGEGLQSEKQRSLYNRRLAQRVFSKNLPRTILLSRVSDKEEYLRGAFDFLYRLNYPLLAESISLSKPRKNKKINRGEEVEEEEEEEEEEEAS